MDNKDSLNVKKISDLLIRNPADKFFTFDAKSWHEKSDVTDSGIQMINFLRKNDERSKVEGKPVSTVILQKRKKSQITFHHKFIFARSHATCPLPENDRTKNMFFFLHTLKTYSRTSGFLSKPQSSVTILGEFISIPHQFYS